MHWNQCILFLNSRYRAATENALDGGAVGVIDQLKVSG